jgi:hypothetical protein
MLTLRSRCLFARWTLPPGQGHAVKHPQGIPTPIQFVQLATKLFGVKRLDHVCQGHGFSVHAPILRELAGRMYALCVPCSYPVGTYEGFGAATTRTK